MQPSIDSVSQAKKLRYAVCGLSLRAIYQFVLPLLGKATGGEGDDFSAVAEIVGILDLDRERVNSFLERQGIQIPYFSVEEGVDVMIRETKPDVLLVAGPDFTHCEHIIAGLQHDLKVIVEKPVVTNSQEMRRVLEAERKSRGVLIVAHNYRYSSLSVQVKRLISEGRIGRITNVEMVYNLDTFHGASYFYRWNRERAKSGGLSVHKCVHHIDLVNWFIGSVPETVFAFGALNYYGPEGAHRPLPVNGNPLSLSDTRQACPYFQQHYAPKGFTGETRLKTGWDNLNLPYDAQYPDDSYIYDPEIDIEDTYSAVIRYRSGASLTYSCNFSTPWEGYILGINGTHGRIEVSHHSNPDPTGLSVERKEREVVVLMPLFGGREEYVIDSVGGGHGGADPLIRRDLFIGPDQESTALHLQAGSYDGALAIAAGEAIWRSAKEGRPYTIRELLGEFYQGESVKALKSPQGA